MNVVFRVDAEEHTGTGHFMRCLTLADALKQRGARIRVVSRHLFQHLREALAEKGIEFVHLESNAAVSSMDELAHAHWLGTSQAQDAQATLLAISDQSWDWLVVDHYALDARWESALRPGAKRIFVIDDIADRHHDCDLLLDQNFYADMENRYRGKVPPHCQMLLGPRYALLREEFRLMRERIAPRSGAVKRILVFFGGVDLGNYTGMAIEALSGIDISDMHVDVVIGGKHPDRERIEAICAERGLACHVQTGKMAELMGDADLSIGAGGSATWERCCLGLPTMAICTADNQRQQVGDAAREGLLYLPDRSDELIGAIQRHACALMENSSLRHALSRNGMRAVDGRGVLRVLGLLGYSSISIRKADREDARRVFEWRNHPAVKAVSRNADSIDWDSHQKWFDSVLASPDRLLLIGERQGLPVGVVRFDTRGNEAEISIYVDPDLVHSGLGRELLQSAECWLEINRPDLCRIEALVLGGNERSMNLFSGAGYQVQSVNYSKRIH